MPIVVKITLTCLFCILPSIMLLASANSKIQKIGQLIFGTSVLTMTVAILWWVWTI